MTSLIVCEIQTHERDFNTVPGENSRRESSIKGVSISCALETAERRVLGYSLKIVVG